MRRPRCGETGATGRWRPSEHEPAKVTEKALIDEMKARDERDRNRAQSPLKPAADAVILDSTELSLDEVLARSEEIVREHVEQGRPEQAFLAETCTGTGAKEEK